MRTLQNRMQCSAVPRPRQRSLLWLVAAAGIFAGALGVGMTQDTQSRQPAQPSGAPAAQSTPDLVSVAQARVASRPDDAGAYAQLGAVLLQAVREHNDTTLYAQAQAAFAEALQRDPQQVDALVGRGMLSLALHDFTGALPWAARALAANPYKAAGLGVRVDALVELGRYDEAVTAAQQMVDLRPDLESYSRVSYLRELHGDVAGAIESMRMAVATAAPGSEPWLWTLTHLGHLYWNRGDLAAAEQIYRTVLRQRPDYPLAQAGLARVFAGMGDARAAITILRPLTERLPLPEFLVALGELYEVKGETRQAKAHYDLIHVIQRLNAAAGINVDLELATFDVEHSADRVAALAAARAAYAQRPTIYAADTLAWALHGSGDFQEAWRYSQEALRLGTQDARLHFHAGIIAQSLGEETIAKMHLKEAEAINPNFSLRDGTRLGQALASLAP